MSEKEEDGEGFNLSDLFGSLAGLIATALFSDLLLSCAFLLNSASLFPAATRRGSFLGFVFFTVEVTFFAGEAGARAVTLAAGGDAGAGVEAVATLAVAELPSSND